MIFKFVIKLNECKFYCNLFGNGLFEINVRNC